jgi:hypothetical protein
MITLTVNVDDISNVLTVFDQVQIMQYIGTAETPPETIVLTDYATVSGTDQISNRTGVSDVNLLSAYSQYYFIDPDGLGTDWYISRYYHSTTGATSGWTSPILGDTGDLYYNPMYPPEVDYGTEDQRVINKIRTWIGDPIGLQRDYGEPSEHNLHPDNTVYQLEEHGWPASINMYGTQYTATTDPAVNGYEYLKFRDAIDTTIVTVSGIQYTIDIWYYTFRNSDRQIMEEYNTAFPPAGLTAAQTTTEIYMLQTAYDILYKEIWEDATEDGAYIKDEADVYNPDPGLKIREKLLGKLKRRLDEAIKFARGPYIGGVLID